MSRKPNIDPGIYQVDLVAGLFGAFMMVWISGAQNSEFPSEGIEPPTYAVLTVQVSMAQANGYGGDFPGSPMAISSQPCLDNRTLQNMGVLSLAALECPTMPYDPYISRDVANFTYGKFDSCRGRPDDPKPTASYKYGRTVQFDLAVPAELRPRGYGLVQGAHVGTLPTFETGWDGLPDLLSSIISTNAKRLKEGREILLCKPEQLARFEASIYQVADAFNIWQRPSIEVTLNGTPTGLSVYGGDAPDPKLKRYLIDGWKPDIAWPSMTINIELCAFRDGSKRCFSWKGPAATATVTLTVDRS